MGATAKDKNRKTWYVYVLADPADNTVFYVGKGCGNRINDHGTPSDKTNQAKIDRINKIGPDNVIRAKVACFLDEQAALDYESEKIRSHSGLANITGNKTGPKIISFYDCVLEAIFGDRAAWAKLEKYFPVEKLPHRDHKRLFNAAKAVMS